MDNSMPEKQQQAESLYNRVQSQNTQRLTTEINKIYDSLVKSINEHPNRIPEKIFIEEFLPFFCGERQLNSEISILSNWIGIAGSPTSEVAVINNKEEELFRVPALYNTNFINPNDPAAQAPSMGTIMGEYENKRSQLPTAGENFLAGALENKANETLQHEDQKDTLTIESRWRAIFEHYGKNPAPNESGTRNTSQDDSKLTDDELVYD